MLYKITTIKTIFRRKIVTIFRQIFHNLPFSEYHKRIFQFWLYRYFPLFFRATASYQIWQSLDRKEAHLLSDILPKPIPLEFSPIANPRVSVAIWVSDGAKLLRCLQALLSIPVKEDYEVLLVIDNQSKVSIETLNKIKGVCIIRHEKIHSPIQFFKIAAAKAKGEYLLVLNEAVVMSAGSIDELIATFRQIPDAGLVGGKLINFEHYLLHAGGLISLDGTKIDLGSGNDPLTPAHNYCREVDFCSEYLFMIPTALTGIFDLLLQDNHETSLAIAAAIKSQKKKLIYQPFVSAYLDNNDVQIGNFDNKDYFTNRQAKNTKAKKISPRIQSSQLARRILVIDASTPTPDRDAGSVTAFYFMQIFTELGLQVSFIPVFDLQRIEKYTADLQRIGIECLYAPFVTDISIYLKEHGHEFDVVLLYRVDWGGRYIADVRKYCPSAKIIFDTVDLHYLRQERQAFSENSVELADIAKITKKKELDLMCQSDVTIVLSEIEKDILANEVPEAAVVAIPLILEMPGCSADYLQRNGIVFIGGYNHQPNIDAVIYFVEEVWPLLKQLIPSMVFYILGSNPPEKIKALQGDGIEVIGYVESLDDYFNQCRISVVPLRYGAGIKGKIGSSFSYGLPVVSTSLGVEGMGIEPGKHALVADTPEAFARAVAELYLDRKQWQAMSEAELQFATDRYSIDAGRKSLSDLLDQLGVDHIRQAQKENITLNVSVG